MLHWHGLAGSSEAVRRAAGRCGGCTREASVQSTSIGRAAVRRLAARKWSASARWPRTPFPRAGGGRQRPPRRRDGSAAGNDRGLPRPDRAARRPAAALHDAVIERVRAKDFALRDFLDLSTTAHCRCSIGPGRSTASPSPTSSTGSSPTAGPERERATSSRSACTACWAWAPADCAAGPSSTTRPALLRRTLRPLAAVGRRPGRHPGRLLRAARRGPAVPGAVALSGRRRPVGAAFAGALAGGTEHAQLGAEAVIGQRVWDVEGKFRVRLGPLGYAEFRRLLPSGDMLRPLCQMVRTLRRAAPGVRRPARPAGGRSSWCRLGGDGADPARAGLEHLGLAPRRFTTTCPTPFFPGRCDYGSHQPEIAGRQAQRHLPPQP